MLVDANERRAFCRIARLLHNRYGRTEANYYLVANIEPKDDYSLQREHLTQLDALLLGPKLAAIIDFKSCYQPFDARNLEGEWPIIPTGDPLHGGSFINPFQQAVNARRKWSHYFSSQSDLFFSQRKKELQIESWHDVWRDFNSFVLLHPLLHPDTQRPTEALEKNHFWFHLRSVEDILELTFSCVSDKLEITSSEQEHLVRNALFAKEWTDMTDILHKPTGSIVIQEPDRSLVRHQVFCDDFFTIGRSYNQRIRVNRALKQVSGYHARIEVTQGQPVITDAGSLNGIFVNGKKVEGKQPVNMTPYLRVFLGDSDEQQACVVWFEPVKLRKTSLTHGPVEPDKTELRPF